MRRTLCLLTAGALLALLAACGVPTVQEEGYRVYFRAQEGTEALQAELHSVPSEADPAAYLLDCLLAGPEEEGLDRAIPSSVTLRGTSLENGVLTVDFSSRYASLSGIDLTLADYSVVKTMTQLEGVETVVINVEGEPIPYRDHQRLAAADAWLFDEQTEAG